MCKHYCAIFIVYTFWLPHQLVLEHIEPWKIFVKRLCWTKWSNVWHTLLGLGLGIGLAISIWCQNKCNATPLYFYENCPTIWLLSYLDNSPPGQFPTIQVWVLMSEFNGCGPGARVLLGIVVPVGNRWVLFIYILWAVHCPSIGSCPKPDSYCKALRTVWSQPFTHSARGI